MSKASSRKNSAASSAKTSDNVIQLPVSPRVSAAQPLLFADDDLGETPPWLIEAAPAVGAQSPKPKAANVKKAAKKRAATPTAKQAKAKTVKPRAKAVPRPARAAKPAKQPAPTATIADDSLSIPAADMVQPIQRAMAPVVWRKNGPVDALRYWLRSTGRTLKAAFTSRPPGDAAAKLADPRLRTRNELLLEIAILRQENAAMRKKLGLPAAPFGRLLADRI